MDKPGGNPGRQYRRKSKDPQSAVDDVLDGIPPQFSDRAYLERYRLTFVVFPLESAIGFNHT